MNVPGNDDRWVNVWKAALLIMAVCVIFRIITRNRHLETRDVPVPIAVGLAPTSVFSTPLEVPDRGPVPAELAFKTTLTDEGRDEHRKTALTAKPDTTKRFPKQEKLAKDALESSSVFSQFFAYNKLADAEIAELASRAEDLVSRQRGLILQGIRRAFWSIPREHQERLYGSIVEVANLAIPPAILSEFGAIDDLQIGWRTQTQRYTQTGKKAVGFLGAIEVSGETLTMSVTFNRLNRAVCHSWSTEFPDTIKSLSRPTWIPARIEVTDFFSEFSGLLSRAVLTQLARESQNDGMREAAMSKLAD